MKKIFNTQLILAAITILALTSSVYAQDSEQGGINGGGGNGEDIHQINATAQSPVQGDIQRLRQSKAVEAYLKGINPEVHKQAAKFNSWALEASSWFKALYPLYPFNFDARITPKLFDATLTRIMHDEERWQDQYDSYKWENRFLSNFGIDARQSTTFFSDRDKQRVTMNPQRFDHEVSTLQPQDIMALVFHEVMVLNNLEQTGLYTYSHQFGQAVALALSNEFILWVEARTQKSCNKPFEDYNSSIKKFEDIVSDINFPEYSDAVRLKTIPAYAQKNPALGDTSIYGDEARNRVEGIITNILVCRDRRNK